jgi:epidermal growth factor receptor substrate 15
MLQPQSTGSTTQKKPLAAPTLPARKVTNPSAIGSSAFGAAPQWDVTAADKASSDGFFDTLDTAKLGYIEGEVAVPFMLESKLPGDVLAQVW